MCVEFNNLIYNSHCEQPKQRHTLYTQSPAVVVDGEVENERPGPVSQSASQQLQYYTNMYVRLPGRMREENKNAKGVCFTYATPVDGRSVVVPSSSSSSTSNIFSRDSWLQCSGAALNWVACVLHQFSPVDGTSLQPEDCHLVSQSVSWSV